MATMSPANVGASTRASDATTWTEPATTRTTRESNSSTIRPAIGVIANSGRLNGDEQHGQSKGLAVFGDLEQEDDERDRVPEKRQGPRRYDDPHVAVRKHSVPATDFMKHVLHTI